MRIFEQFPDRYYLGQNDNSGITCSCGEYLPTAGKLIIGFHKNTQAISCRACVDMDWLNAAKFLGILTDAAWKIELTETP